ncbi:hypothetical protein M8C21_012111, partial [Ambrosia artemisiifolia]
MTIKTLHSFLIKRINKSIKPGDCVLMRSPDPSKPYVAKLKKIESESRGSNVSVHVQWYYRPEETIGGRKQYHGSKEVFLSDHHDVQSAETIEGKCTVHTFKRYMKLEAVGNDEFFCRFQYVSATGDFNPNKAVVFHPSCIDMTAEEAKAMEHFFCPSCLSDDQKLLQSSHVLYRHSSMKV